ncbi:MAG TPA: peptidoglycan-binding protein [Chitinispirillaceae bacterium]|nr:peptidoglycan-binding protein [Chitinispirillaceae bacterium]
MLLGRNEVPFPENPHCKRCASKNCRELLVQPLFPGKVIFVHRRQFCSIPDYIPSWRNEESAAPAKEVALTDELEVTEGAIEIAAPTWEHSNEEYLQDYPEKALEGAKILLSTQIKNYPEGAPVTFDIYDNSESTPLLIKSIKGTHEGGTATAEWIVEDPQQKGDNLKLAIEASARSKYSRRSDIPYLAKLKCDFVEMPDVLFNHGSAVPCLDTGGILLGALSAAFIYAKNNNDREVVLFGHSDTSGDASYNYDLSQWRAEAIKAIIDNDVESFLDVIDLASKIEDCQTFLSALSECHGWNCHPGKIDNIAGEKTKTALKDFQTEYNTKFNGNLKVDGTIGPKTWTALFNVTRLLLEEIVQKECGDFPVLTYGYNGKGIYPCGESFPVDQSGVDGIKSKTNRRVEIVFFEKGKSAELQAPADKKKVGKKEAAVYDKKKAEIKPVKVNPPKPVESDTIILEFIFPQAYDASKPHKQYVNLDSNGKEQGCELTIKVKAKDLKANTAGKSVYWRVTANNNNSKRNSPKTGIMDKAGGKLVEFTAGIANLDTPFANNETSIVLACGLAGGDRFTVEAGTDGENFTSKFLVENWRKLWYQLTHEKGLALPSFNITEKAWADMFVEIKRGNKKEFEKKDCDALEKQHIHTFYNEYVIKPGGSDKEVAVIGSHNSSFFHKMYTNDPMQSPKVHFVVCQHQWDEGSILNQFVTEKLESKISGEINLNSQVFYPYLKGDLFYKGTWKSLAVKGHKDFGKNGVLTNEWILLEKNRSSLKVIKLKIPDSVELTPDNKAPVEITFKLRTVLGPYLGESNGHQILAVSDPKDPTDFNNTLTHEAAHSFNQVPEPGAIPPGLGNHHNQYTDCGGIGSHCNTISDKNNEGKAGKLNKDGEYSTGVCVMFHAGDPHCINKFCSVCEPYVKAADFSGFRKV